MAKFWLKIWIGIKFIFAMLVLIYLIAFIAMNHGNKAEFWVWYHQTFFTSSLMLAFCAFVIGLATAFFTRSAMRTVRQLRELQGRVKDQKSAHQQEDQKAKAAMLRTKPEGPAGGA